MAIDDFRRILWAKSVSLDEEICAYAKEDETSRAREPRWPGDVFDLHCTEEDADSLAEPAAGEIIVLVQHGLVTHLAEARGAGVVPRPKKTIRKGTRDARFSRQRECVLIVLRTFDDASTIEVAFGFDAAVTGGEVLSIGALDPVASKRHPLWMVQRRIHNAMTRAPKPPDLDRANRRALRPPPWRKGGL